MLCDRAMTGNASASAREEDVRAVLASYLSRVTASSILRAAAARAGVSASDIARVGLDAAVLRELRRGIAMFVPEAKQAECVGRLQRLLVEAPPSGAAGRRVHLVAQEMEIRGENGIIDARTRARSLAAELGFRSTDQYQIATAVSELSRNVLRYAGTGKVRLGAITTPRRGMIVIAEDHGPGIEDLALVLSDAYRSTTGMGRGLRGCKEIMDDFEVDTGRERGTTVTVRKYL